MTMDEKNAGDLFDLAMTVGRLLAHLGVMLEARGALPEGGIGTVLRTEIGVIDDLRGSSDEPEPAESGSSGTTDIAVLLIAEASRHCERIRRAFPRDPEPSRPDPLR